MTKNNSSSQTPEVHSPIVSSSHLASEDDWQLSELEYAMTMTYNAFSRWMIHCMASAGYRDFNPLDILVLHNVNHRTREKSLSDITFMLNIDDSHTVNYSLKKLSKAGLVVGNKQGKEISYRTTTKGAQACEKYREIRETCLVNTASTNESDLEDIRRAATLLRGMSGLYDQASRSASSL